MKTITDLQEANRFLEKYTDSKLQVVIYDLSLKRLAIGLNSIKFEEVLYIVGVGCESLNGHFSYDGANLYIEEMSNRDNGYWVVADKSEIFSLVVSGGFSLAHGNESEFGTSFNDFIKSH